MNNQKYLNWFLYFSYVVFFVSLAGKFRAFSSISIAMIFLTGIIKNKNDPGKPSGYSLKNPFLISCSIFYLLQVIMLLNSGNIEASLEHLQIKSALIFIPLALSLNNYLNKNFYRKLMIAYVWILFITMSLCLLVAFYRYYYLHQTNDVFFYHALVSLFNQHAVQVSILLFTALIYLLELTIQKIFFYNKPIHIFIVLFLTVCIVLLSSKLVILFLMACFIFYLVTNYKKYLRAGNINIITIAAGITICLLIIFTRNKVSKRFADIASGDMNLYKEQKFNSAIYFNGLQFRLLQFRFVNEILTDQHCWLTGVGNNAQEFLDKKYISTGMYIGDTKKGDHGFIGYDTHNQFLESLLQFGIPGLITFIFICYTMARLAMHKKNRHLTLVIILLLAYSLNESVLERQYGIIIFTFFPLFLYYNSESCEAGIQN